MSPFLVQLRLLKYRDSIAGVREEELMSANRHALASLAIAAAIGGCASTQNETASLSQPVPVIALRDLPAGCTYSRLDQISTEGRSGLASAVETETRREIGMEAARLGADAVIDFKVATVMSVGGGTALGGGTRATGTAIRFTSDACRPRR
jgi:hypothetical protein